MPQQGFAASISKWVAETKERQEAVFKTAAESAIEEMIDRTPVKTGFLRAGITAALNEPVPISEEAKPAKDAGAGSYPAPDYSLTISNATLGDTIYATFTAVYARRIEYGFTGLDKLDRHYNQPGVGMVRLAAQNWPTHVQAAVKKAQAAVAAQPPAPAPRRNRGQYDL